VHNLSKRTALYGTYAYIKNKDDGALGQPGHCRTLKDNGSQHGLQVGIRHAF
jgi:predicted porin